MTKRYEIRVNEEYTGEEFWDAVAALADGLEQVNDRYIFALEEAQKDILIKALATLPGWLGDQPANPKSPLIVTEIEE